MQSDDMWVLNPRDNSFYISDYIKSLLCFDSNNITIELFSYIVGDGNRDSFLNNIKSIINGDIVDNIFLTNTPIGFLCINMQVISINEDNSIIGKFAFVNVDNNPNIDNNSENHLQDIMLRQKSISQSLLSFLDSNNVLNSVNNTLNDILDKFEGDRVYIFEFDRQNKTQSCKYEVTRTPELKEIDTLQDIPIEDTEWWSYKLISGVPIILDNISDLPEEAENVRSLLLRQNITSVMAIPLSSNNIVWGYIGIDILHSRHWNNIDYEWFYSLANIISLCIKLRELEKNAEDERKYMEDLYQNMPMGYIRLKSLRDSNGCIKDYRIEEINTSGMNILGLENKSYHGVLGSEINLFHLQYSNRFQNIDSSNTAISLEVYMPDRERHVNSVNYSPGKNEIVSLFFDVTDNIKVREALMSSEEKLKKIYQNIPIGIEVYDKNGYLLDINEIEMEIFGLKDKNQAIGLQLFTNPNLPEDQMERLRQGEDVCFDLVYDFQKARDGYYDSKHRGIKRLTAKCTTLHDLDKNIEYYLLIVIDNTDTYNAYATIHETDSVFEYLGSFAEIGYFKWDLLQNTGYAFNQWFRNFGEEINDDRDIVKQYDKMHYDDIMELDRFYDQVKKGKQTQFQKEMRIWNGDGWDWARCNIKVKEYNPELDSIVIVGVNINITELKRTQENLFEAKTMAEESDRLKTAFLANMSHEIRTPLNAIVGFSNLISEKANDPKISNYTSIIHKNNEILLQLISDILDISKIESGVFDIDNSNINVNSFCKEVISSIMQRNPLINIDIVLEEYPSEHVIYLDKSKIQQILFNLINNALKFTKGGYIKIGYTIKENNIEFFVQDTGIGINKHDQKRIFDRFVKIDPFSTGTGLGLHICKSIVERLNGAIWVESEEEKGSCFYFSIPFNRPPQETSLKSNGNDKPLILIAENNGNNYLLLSVILKNYYNLIRASNGKEAVELYTKYKPDIILMDIKMPVMNGLEAIRKIRETDKKIPIIAISAFAFDRDKSNAYDAGCNDYLTKPISHKILKDSIAKLLAQ